MLAGMVVDLAANLRDTVPGRLLLMSWQHDSTTFDSFAEYGFQVGESCSSERHVGYAEGEAAVVAGGDFLELARRFGKPIDGYDADGNPSEQRSEESGESKWFAR